MQDSFVEFLDELTCTAKEIIPDLQVSMFNMPFTSQYFTRKASQIPGIDYTGFDGCISKQSFFKEEPKKIKHTLPEVWGRVQEEAALSGKKTFMLIENMLMPRKVHEEYEIELTNFLEYAKPDHLSCYYYAHNNEAPEEVHNITMRILKRQLQKETIFKSANKDYLENKINVCV